MIWRTGCASWTAVIGAAMVMTIGSGCSLFRSNPAGTMNLTADSLPKPPMTEAAPSAGFTVEIRPSGKKPEIEKIELRDAMFVRQVLEQTGADNRFRRMKLYLMRSADGGRHKLDLKFDHVNKMVDPLYDYAMHPGDHLVVIEDTSTALDDMVNAFAEPLGLPTNERRR